MHRPEILVLPGDRERFDALRADPATTCHDTIAGQLGNLLETRDPAGTRDPKQLAAEVLQRLGDDPEAYGAWAYFPWSRRLVHLLPQVEFHELRTSRNRNKITEAEQERLRSLRIGIVGLSIGQAAAVTLTLEGIGGYFALADFDHLELSNMNRLRAGVHELEVNKAVLAARQIAEIDPYLPVDVWTDGVDDANIDAFLASGGPPLDLVYEECDDLQMKILVREHARAHRIPVLMESSDRGLMDIERFDLEPDRPLFHGLVGDVRASELKGLSNYDKIPIVMRIIGRRGMSDRMAASLVDVEASLKSFPQLASEVALGAGINVDTARRIALDQLDVSGRFYVDLAEHIAPDKAVELGGVEVSEVQISAEAARFDLPELTPVERVDATAVEMLVAWATTAFSGGNCQPWRFHLHGHRLTIAHDVERSRSFLDVDHRASQLAFGSVLETLELVGAAVGLRPRIDLFPDPDDPERIADVHLDRFAALDVDPLVHHIGSRVTNRRLGPRRPFDVDDRTALTAQASAAGGSVQWLESAANLDRAADLLGRVDRIRMLSKTMHQEMMHELRWTVDDVERTRDGLDVATLELKPPDLAGMRMISSWPVMKMVGVVGGGLGLERPTRNAIAACSAVGLLTIVGSDAKAFVRAGRALHRLWVAAAARGVAFQPMTTATYLFHRLVHAGGRGFTPNEIAQLKPIRAEWTKLFSIPEGHAEPMVFRVAYTEPPTARSLRRQVHEVLHLG